MAQIVKSVDIVSSSLRFFKWLNMLLRESFLETPLVMVQFIFMLISTAFIELRRFTFFRMTKKFPKVVPFEHLFAQYSITCMFMCWNLMRNVIQKILSAHVACYASLEVKNTWWLPLRSCCEDASVRSLLVFLRRNFNFKTLNFHVITVVGSFC